MKREIKFRGKCIQSGDWVIGDLIHGVGPKYGKTYILPAKVNLAYVKHCDPLDGVAVDPETVGLYTGIKDKFDTEIYEGDIVDSGIAFPEIPSEREVIWGKNCGLQFIPVTGNSLCGSNSVYFTVLGNIHDNPELIEK